MEEKANTSFEVTSEQLGVIESMAKINNQKDWLDFKKQDGSTMKDFLYSFLKPAYSTQRKESIRIAKIKKDQERRAKQLIKDLLSTEPKKKYSIYRRQHPQFDVEKEGWSTHLEINKTEVIKNEENVGTIVLMDGHGRLVWQLLNEWYNVQERTDKLRLIVIEWNAKNHKFHKKFFPPDITCYKGNVFNKSLYVYNEIGADGKITEIPCKEENMVVYFNFTSIGDQGRKLYQRLAENASKGIDTHWSYAAAFLQSKEMKEATSTLLTSTHEFMEYLKGEQDRGGFGYFYGLLEDGLLEDGNFISYPVDRYSLRSGFYSMRLDLNNTKDANIRCIEFESAHLTLNCEQFEDVLKANNNAEFKQLLPKKAIFGNLMNTSISGGVHDLCSINIYTLECDGNNVKCGNTTWEFRTIKQANMFLFTLRWVFFGMYVRYIKSCDSLRLAQGTVRTAILGQLMHVLASMSYAVQNHITQDKEIRKKYNDILTEVPWKDEDATDLSWLENSSINTGNFNKYDVVNKTPWAEWANSSSSGGESKSNLQDTLVNAFRNLRF